MNKIIYPTDRVDFEKKFYSALSIKKTKLDQINVHLNKIEYNGAALNFEILVKLKFEDLIRLEPKIKKYSDLLNTPSGEKNAKGEEIIINEFTDLFNYKDNQPKLADFFMNQSTINLKSCFYCSIEFINAFNDFPDYSSKIEFINKADIYELQYIKGIDETIAKGIIEQRKKSEYNDIAELPTDNYIKKEIESIPFNNSHNQFTLDHLIPQHSHKFYSLCLYNLVPSCYSCNSKFKKKSFKIDNNLKYISPTSQKYSFNNDFKFEIFYTKNFEEITSVKDFAIRKKITKNEEQVQAYLRMFKIPGRYVYHKDLILELILKKAKYSDSQIIEISKLTGLSIKKIEEDIFGEELFNSDLSHRPFVKFKRDIADDIGITKQV